MISDLKPYPAYKDSGAPWLGTVPEHWGLRRIKTLFREKDERSGVASGVLLSLTRARGIVPQAEASNRIASADDLSKYKVCRPGDLVMNRMQAWSGMFAVSSHKGLVSPDYCIFGAIKISAVKYFEQLFKTPTFVSQFAQRSKGIGSGFNRLYTPDFGAVPVIVPPVPEQFLIVHYLNHLDRRIRRYIRAKQKLIKLLEEQKQAIIHRAVTRGLDPDVRFQSLGSAPPFQVNGRWQISRLWQLVRIQSEKNRPELGLLSIFLGRGVIPYDKGGGQVHKPSIDLSGYQVVGPGDLVLNNQQAWRGSVGVSKFHGIISPAYLVLSLSDVLESRFAHYLFQSRVMVAQYVTSSKGVGDIQRDIHTPWLLKVRVPIPPRDKQIAIAIFLDKQLAEISSQLSLYEREIDLLRELRTRLISDVVTGKLDVREAAERLPDEAEEPELIGDTAAMPEGAEEGEGAGINPPPEEDANG